ncbi:hypothetical protein [Halosimplex pelagicum]|uniref:Uncharacterized protein n=1 Tax=Halosimplex pelagicum TaxID=869886 RepID=A0A7D5PCI7_9EURY|nr:hypothetical protein [Halosimplex pelagicum]QLH83222.1 hypothetical protein HZS54_16995 [Halosimplex pelagicum]
MQVIERLKHPVTGLAVVVSAIGQLGFGAFEPAWALVSSTATYWFPALATSGATILPELGFPNLGTQVLLGAALVYVGVQLDRLVDKIQDWQEDR